jgi:hypothetical protein
MHSDSAKLRYLRFRFHNTDTGLKWEKSWKMRGEEGRRQVGRHSTSTTVGGLVSRTYLPGGGVLYSEVGEELAGEG